MRRAGGRSSSTRSSRSPTRSSPIGAAFAPARYRHRPLHLFGGLGLILGLFGSAILVYLTVLKALGNAIGHRPLLMLGVLLVVIGLQFFSLGLISEMITSHHEERAQERDRAELLVDEVLS